MTQATLFMALGLTIVSWRDPAQVVQAFELLGGWLAPFRFLLATLLHGDAFHITFNLMWVYQWLPWLERRFGAGRALGGMVFLALASAVPQWFLDGPGIGLSGVVYGFWGFFYVAQRSEFMPLSSRDTRLFVGWGLFCIVATELGWLNVANIAHGAGALAGAVGGWIWNRLGQPAVE